MSGLYLPGMKMPKGCATCPYSDRAWNKPKCKAKSVQGRFMEQRLNLDRTRQKWCPLVPVPEHGRLGDFDELLDRAFGCLDEETFLAFQFFVNGSVTIIPAEEVEG